MSASQLYTINNKTKTARNKRSLDGINVMSRPEGKNGNIHIKQYNNIKMKNDLKNKVDAV